MMKKLLGMSLCAVLVLAGPVVRAEDPASLLLTDGQIATIRTNCVEVQSSLQRIHSSDALARFNLGQQYNIISTKLMAPMNSRLAINKIDGVAMTQTTVDFDREIDRFNTSYQQYEQTMQRALKMNCREQPVSFFDTITLARDHRAAVRESVDKINTLLRQYKAQFDAVRVSIPADIQTKGTS